MSKRLGVPAQKFFGTDEEAARGFASRRVLRERKVPRTAWALVALIGILAPFWLALKAIGLGAEAVGKADEVLAKVERPP